VGDAEVARSNEIMVMLRDTARRHTALRQQLAALPMHAVAQVGGERVAIVHGDLESLAGWSLAQQSPFSSHEEKILKNQILMPNCRIVACSHTCLPVAWRMGDAVIINNGAAGMPNFRDTRFGVITRIATTPSPHAPHYGTRVGATHVDALALEYDRVLWQQQFLAQWPAGSAAHESYFRRITHGPAYGPDDANRLAVSNAATARPMLKADLATGKLS
jgi:diadenosine tetraphosphatase ApaH/serine/threonine PP2A family protein phosphatase